MITANNSVGPSTLLTLNGVISTPSSVTPPALLAVSAGGGASNRPSLTAPVFAPTFMPSNSTAFANTPTLLPPGPFSGSTTFPTHLFPYFAPPNGTVFAQTPPGTFPSVSFNANGSMFVAQPQTLVAGNSVNFPQFNSSGMSGVSTNSLFSGPPTATVVLAAPMSCEMGSTSVAQPSINSPCFTACGTNVTPIYTDVLSASMPTSSGVPMVSMSGSSNSMLTMPSTTMVYSSLPLTSISSASNLVTCPRILTSSESSGPIALKSKLELQGTKSIASAANSANSNLLALESAEFHRGFILEAIDKLRERKARPDFERISCLLKRQHSIPPMETQLCLGRLAETGAVVCVDYKGNLSYRNPSKWRKTAISGLGMMNTPSVSRRIIDAMRFLMSSVNSKGPDESFPQSPVGFTSLQIERALQQRSASSALPPSSSGSTSGIESGPQSSSSSSSSSASSNSSSSKAPTEGTSITATGTPLCSELTGTNLRISLEREATYGKLARMPNGQYVLDETGERKKSLGVGPGYPLSSISLLNKRPLPPKGSLLYPGGGNKVGPMPPSFVKPVIAPALDTSGKSPLPKPNNVVSIAPNGRGIMLRRPPNIGKRGRPPGGKVRKILSAAAVTNAASITSVKPAILPASSDPSASTEKRPKLENMLAPKPAFPGFVPMDMGCESAIAPVPPTLPPSLTCPTGPCISSICPAPPLMMFHTQPASFYGQLVTQPPPPPHPIAGVFAVNGDALLSFPDADAQIPEVSYTFGQHQSAVLPPLQSLPVTDAAPVTVKPDGSLPEAETCCRCRGLATAEEPFLVCKECGIQAHPTCLDYWPELTARARKEEWQCADCKSCSICKDATSEAVVLICDACDRGYHTTCHNPPVLEEVDRNMPWVCSQCQVEAYQRQLPQETGDQESSDIQAAGSSASQLIDEEAETRGQARADGHGLNERSFDGTDATASSENTPSVVGTMAPTDSSEELNLGTGAIVTSPAATTNLLSAECSYPSSSPSNGDVIRALRSPKPNGNVPEDAASQMPVLDCESVCPPTDSALGREMPSTFVADEDAGLHSEEKENLVTVSLPVKNPKDCPVPDNIGSKRAGEGRTDETAVVGASSQPRPEDVKAWTVSEVSDWLTEEGFTKEAETFAQQDIDGASLILMKRMDVFTELGIKLGPAVKIYERIKRLQATCISQDP
ncbi:Sterile alpha motif [Sparganum proliferum]